MTSPDHGQIKLETTAKEREQLNDWIASNMANIPEAAIAGALLTDFHTLRAHSLAVEKAVAAERKAIADEVARYADFYQPHSDGRNTFVMLTDWIDGRSRPSVPVTDTEPEATRKQVEEEIATWIRWLKDNYTEIEDLEPAAIAVAITSGDYRTGKAGG